MFLSSQYSESQASETSCLMPEHRRRSPYRLNEQPTYGIYNRNDYMARCYRKCWKKNSKRGPELKTLLCFGGKSSHSGDCLSLFLFALIFFMPLFSFILFFLKQFEIALVMSIAMLIICIILSVWHIHSIRIIIRNKKLWIRSWFAFNIEEDLLVPKTKQVRNRFFDVRKHLRYFDVTRQSLENFPLLTNKQKQGLYTKFQCENLNRARIILYTRRYLQASVSSTLIITATMLVLTAFGFSLSLYILIDLLLRL